MAISPSRNWLTQTQRTLSYSVSYPENRGHLLNWYDTRTLEPLVAALRFLGRQRQPAGFALDVGARIARATEEAAAAASLGRRTSRLPARAGRSAGVSSQAAFAVRQRMKGRDWLAVRVRSSSEKTGKTLLRSRSAAGKPSGSRSQTHIRLQGLQELVRSYVPWELPEFAPLCAATSKSDPEPAESSAPALPQFIDDLHNRLELAMPSISGRDRGLYENLAVLLPQARANALHLTETLRNTAAEAGSSPMPWISVSC